MKICIITDTHFGGRSGNQYLIKNQEKFFTNTFFPTLKENNVTTILHGGDLFDIRKFITYQSLHDTKEIFLDKLVEYGITMHIIAGNHDITYKNTNKINSLDLLLKEYKNINVYSNDVENLEFDKLKIAMVPWINPENSESIQKQLRKSSSDYILGHFEIEGFVMSGGEKCKHGLKPEIFSKFDKVYSGHFHVPSQKHNIEYIGAPYQMDWSDYGGDRGFLIIDSETLEVEFISNPYTMFKVIDYDDTDAKVDDLEDLDEELFEDSYVKLNIKKVSNKALLEKFIEKVESFDVADVKINETYEESDNDEEEKEETAGIEETISLVMRHIDEQNYDEVKKEAIKAKFRDLYNRRDE